MRYTKQLLTLQQQIDVLKRRGLLIANDNEAKNALDTISYFRLAGYWRLMEADKQQHIFKPNARFSHVMSLYHFDEELRLLVFSAIQQIELGTLSKLYSNMDDSAAKKAVSRSFMIPKFEYMRSWLRCITVVRNICAHHARLWNAVIVVNPSLPGRLPNNWISNRQLTPDKLYPHLCYIAYWLNAINPSNTFTKDTKALLSKYPIANPAAMGFPREIRKFVFHSKSKQIVNPNFLHKMAA